MTKKLCTIKRAREILGKSASTSMECITRAQVKALGGDESYLTKYISDNECVNEEDVVKVEEEHPSLISTEITSVSIDIGISLNPSSVPHTIFSDTTILISAKGILEQNGHYRIMGYEAVVAGHIISGADDSRLVSSSGLANGNINIVNHNLGNTFLIIGNADFTEPSGHLTYLFPNVVVEDNGKRGTFRFTVRLSAT